MKQLVPFFFLLITVVSCQREAVEAPVNSDFTSLEQTLAFLAAHHPEVYTPAEVNRVKTLLAEPVQTRGNGVTVEVTGGSEDALQAAIDEAGEGGTVVLKAGEHILNGMVTIGHQITLTAEAGASVVIHNTPYLTFTENGSPGIYIHNAPGAVIKGVNFQAGNGLGGTCILVHHADNVTIEKCHIENFQFSILDERGDNLRIVRNRIIVTSAWQTGAIPEAEGVVIANGRNVVISNNQVSNGFFGIWPCDQGGVTMGNETFGCYYGQILCKVPLYIPLFDGTVIGADESANHWLLINNNSHDNLYAGYVAIDGTHDNFIVGNKAANNAEYDIELTGATDRFGFLVPGSYNNHVYLTPNFIVKDCGENNKVVGGQKVDTSVDACF